MPSPSDPFADLSLQRAIELRWALRDILAERLALLPVSEDDRRLLTERGLIELTNGVPRLTAAGHAALSDASAG